MAASTETYIRASTDGKFAEIRVPMTGTAVSSTGKSINLYTTGGFVMLPGGEGAKIALNIIRKAPKGSA